MPRRFILVRTRRVTRNIPGGVFAGHARELDLEPDSNNTRGELRLFNYLDQSQRAGAPVEDARSDELRVTSQSRRSPLMQLALGLRKWSARGICVSAGKLGKLGQEGPGNSQAVRTGTQESKNIMRRLQF